MSAEGYHLYLVPDAGAPSFESFPSLDDLVDRLRALHGRRDLKVHPYRGAPLAITAPPRHLLVDDRRIPLGPVDSLPAPDPTGSLAGPEEDLEALFDEPAGDDAGAGPDPFDDDDFDDDAEDDEDDGLEDGPG